MKLVIRMLTAKRENEDEFEIWGTGKPEREWIFVRDIAELLTIAVERIETQIDPVNLAQGRGCSIGELAGIIKEIIGYEGSVVFNREYQDGAPKKIMDDSLFRELFAGYRFTEIEEGIAETVRYYEKNL